MLIGMAYANMKGNMSLKNGLYAEFRDRNSKQYLEKNPKTNKSGQYLGFQKRAGWWFRALDFVSRVADKN